MRETERIRDLLDRAVVGDAWHGPALLPLLAGVPAELAASHPIPGAHSILELTLHATAWQEIVRRRLGGDAVGAVPDERDWPRPAAAGVEGWRRAVSALEEGHRALAAAVASTPDGRLDDPVPGESHSVYVMLHGLIQHHLYHAGQIAVLKRAAGVAPLE